MYGWAILVVLGVAAAVLDVGYAACWPVAPYLGLTLAGWLWVRASERSVLWRLVVVGLLLDAADPGSQYFYTLSLPLVAAALHPLRTILVRHTVISWVVGAGLFLGAVRVLDGLGSLSGGLTLALASTALSMWLIIPLAWLLEYLPRRWHPAGA